MSLHQEDLTMRDTFEMKERRGSLDPIWVKLHGHEQDIRELYRYSAQAHERMSAATEALTNLRLDMKAIQQQVHDDNIAVLSALGEVKVEQAAASGSWRIIKWGVPLVIATSGSVLAGLRLMQAMGVVH